MNKTIKIKKEMNFIELMEYILENDIRDREFRCSIDDHVFRVCEEGIFEFYCENYGMGETYEIEVEETITEDTEFDTLVKIFDDETFNETATIYRHGTSIREVKGSRTKKIYALIDGELHLVWECDSDD